MTTINGLPLPKIIFGTSSLGNLYTALSDEAKTELVQQTILTSKTPVIFDSAGKYGAGLALESLGKCLRHLEVDPLTVTISNKLGWYRTALTSAEPTFEKGVWKDLKFDAIQKISYGGILECFDQGNQLLNGYFPQWVSVHDPDEYLANASTELEEQKLYQDILGAYKALLHLKSQGRVAAVGVGAKNWRVIQKIASDVPLDWVMFANSFTIMKHPKDLLNFMKEISERDVLIINSAVFHSGFLIGSDYFDYGLIAPGTAENDALLNWRKSFFRICSEFDVEPADACVQFALSPPFVSSIALNTSNAKRIGQNIRSTETIIPQPFWDKMSASNLIDFDFPFLK